MLRRERAACPKPTQMVRNRASGGRSRQAWIGKRRKKSPNYAVKASNIDCSGIYV